MNRTYTSPRVLRTAARTTDCSGCPSPMLKVIGFRAERLWRVVPHGIARKHAAVVACDDPVLVSVPPGQGTTFQ